MTSMQYFQTTFEILLIGVVIAILVYEPILAKWEEKQKEKVLKALKKRKRYRK